MSLEIDNLAYVSRNLPQAGNEAADKPMRASRYGDQSVQVLGGPRHALADEGSYFVATNPTPGTAISLGTDGDIANYASFSDTIGFFLFQNKDPANDPASKRIYLDYLRLRLTTAPGATAVSMNFAMKLDYIRRDASTAANRTVLTPVNVNGDSTRGSACQPYSFSAAAAMTIPAASGAARIVSRCTIPSSLAVVGDEYFIQFGATDHTSVAGLTAARATAVARLGTTAAPIIIGPQQWLVIHMWWLTITTTTPIFEFEAGWWER